MPKPTFANLPDDKRERIFRAAIEEFVAHPYDSASLTRIAERADISKGSLYQYFDDKLDLFEATGGWAGAKKVAYVTPPEGTGGLFDQLRAMYVTGVDFMRDEPKLAQFFARHMEPSSDERFERLRQLRKSQSVQFFKGLIKAAMHRGELRPLLDVELSAHIFHNLMSDGLGDTLLHRTGLSAKDIAQDPCLALRIRREDLMDVVDETLDILKRGFAVAAADTE